MFKNYLTYYWYKVTNKLWKYIGSHISEWLSEDYINNYIDDTTSWLDERYVRNIVREYLGKHPIRVEHSRLNAVLEFPYTLLETEESGWFSGRFDVSSFQGSAAVLQLFTKTLTSKGEWEWRLYDTYPVIGKGKAGDADWYDISNQEIYFHTGVKVVFTQTKGMVDRAVYYQLFWRASLENKLG